MEVTFNLNGFQIKAKTWGKKEGSPVLAIHGWLDNANTFDKILPFITEDAYVVAIDLSGHGHSDHRAFNSSYYLWDYAIDILHVIEQLGWKKCGIIAHSMGTGVAVIIAGALPNLVQNLICIEGLGAPFVVAENNIVSSFQKSVRQLKMARKTQLYGFSSKDAIQFKTVEEAVEDRVDNVIGPISYDAAKCLTERSLQSVKDGFRWRYDPRIVLSECYKMTETQVQLFVEGITCKTLIILGKQGLFSENKERIQKFKNAKVHWLSGGHHLHLEESHQQISTLINQFLQTK